MTTVITNQALFTPAFQKEETVRARSISVKADDYKLTLQFAEQRKVGEETSWNTIANIGISSSKLYELAAAFLEPIYASVKRNLFATHIKDLPADGVLLRASITLADMYVLRCTAGFKTNGEKKDRFLRMQLFKAPSWQWLSEKRNLDRNKQDWGSDNIVLDWDLTGQYPANGIFSTTTDLIFLRQLYEVFQDIHLCRNTTWQAHKSAIYEANKGKNTTSNPDAEAKVSQGYDKPQEVTATSFDEEFPF